MEIIGEKINTTRKDVGKAVRERDAVFIQELARKQAEGGATFLDVNSGLALYPEEEAEDFAWLVPLIQKVVDLPLCIDSGRSQPIEAALKLHRGKAMINSVNGEPAKMEEIFPLVKKYGCKVIALTSSTEGGIPATSHERLKIAEAIATKAQIYWAQKGSLPMSASPARIIAIRALSVGSRIAASIPHPSANRRKA